MRRLPVLVALVLAGVGGSAWAQAPGEQLVELCTDNGLGDRTCVSVDSGAVLAGSLCTQLGGPPDACAAASDGIELDPARIDAFERSWVHRALRLQSELDRREPLLNTLWPHTHNSSNSTAYAPSVSNLDPNQRWSILDQLRMGARAIEFDLHPAPGGDGVVLCHGRQVDLGATIVHLGCSVDRPLSAGLAELRAFLDTPGNEGEVVLLYLENQLEDDVALHDEVGAALEAGLGDLVARPPADQPCAEMPLERSRQNLLDAGHRVLIVGNCGPGAWGSWVHERGPRWDERSLGDGYPAYPECIAAEREPLAYDANWVRVYEDATWLSAMVDGRYRPETPDDVRTMVRCGVDMVGFDRLDPGDGRLEALVWSWAPDEPVADAATACVAWGTDARFRAADCDEHRGYACRDAGGAWVVPAAVGPMSGAVAACASMQAQPATPPTGWENERLRVTAATTGGATDGSTAAATTGSTELWLSIGNPAVAGASTPAPAEPAPVAPAAAPSSAPSLPATGGGAPLDVYAMAGLSLAVVSGWAARRSPSRRP